MKIENTDQTRIYGGVGGDNQTKIAGVVFMFRRNQNKKKICDVVIFVNARNAFPCEMMISSRDETQKKNSLFLIENA